MMIPTLQSERLHLRTMTTSDVGAYFALRSDVEVSRYLPGGTFRSKLEAEAAVQRRVAMTEQGDGVVWAITRGSDPALIGEVLLLRYQRNILQCSIGYVLGRANWGQGLAREAIVLAVSFAFEQQGMRRVCAEIDPKNTASIRAVESVGFRLEEVIRDNYTDNEGNKTDSAIYVISPG